ncbi:F-box/LRR-repeat protein 7 isoform 2-T2 [Pangshura tecta]
MGANNGKQYGSEGKGSSSISSDVSSSTDHTPTKAQKNAATSEDSDLSMRTLSTPSPALICPQNSHGFQNGRGSSTSSSSVTGETVAMVHSPPPTRLTHPLIRLASRQQKEQANIDRLPDHSMIQIFSFLPTNQLCRCARVCRRWYNLAWDPRLWRTIRLTGETINVDRALKVLTRRLCQDTPNVCLMLETVIVSGCRRLTDRGLYTIAQCCPELRRLEVSGCYNISNEAVFDVVSLCPNLEHLDVSNATLRSRLSVLSPAEKLQNLRKRPRKSKDNMLHEVMHQSLTENQKAQEWRERESRIRKENAAHRKQSTERLISILEHQVNSIQVLVAMQAEHYGPRAPLYPLFQSSFPCAPMSARTPLPQHPGSYHHQLPPTPVCSPTSPENYDPYLLHSTPITMQYSHPEVQHSLHSTPDRTYANL